VLAGSPPGTYIFKHYVRPLQTESVICHSVLYNDSRGCENLEYSIQQLFPLLDEVELPFPYPVALPVSFQ
jgi:hypothetical protein